MKTFTRVPMEVLLDNGLGYQARCVYGVLASQVGDGNVAQVSQRELAKRLGAHQPSVQTALARLVERGHLKVQDVEGKKLKIYVLTSKVFAWKQRKGIQAVEFQGGGPKRRLTSVGEDR